MSVTMGIYQRINERTLDRKVATKFIYLFHMNIAETTLLLSLLFQMVNITQRIVVAFCMAFNEEVVVGLLCGHTIVAQRTFPNYKVIYYCSIFSMVCANVVWAATPSSDYLPSNFPVLEAEVFMILEDQPVAFLHLVLLITFLHFNALKGSITVKPLCSSGFMFESCCFIDLQLYLLSFGRD